MMNLTFTINVEEPSDCQRILEEIISMRENSGSRIGLSYNVVADFATPVEEWLITAPADEVVYLLARDTDSHSYMADVLKFLVESGRYDNDSFEFDINSEQGSRLIDRAFEFINAFSDWGDLMTFDWLCDLLRFIKEKKEQKLDFDWVMGKLRPNLIDINLFELADNFLSVENFVITFRSCFGDNWSKKLYPHLRSETITAFLNNEADDDTRYAEEFLVGLKDAVLAKRLLASTNVRIDDWCKERILETIERELKNSQ